MNVCMCVYNGNIIECRMIALIVCPCELILLPNVTHILRDFKYQNVFKRILYQ